MNSEDQNNLDRGDSTNVNQQIESGADLSQNTDNNNDLLEQVPYRGIPKRGFSNSSSESTNQAAHPSDITEKQYTPPKKSKKLLMISALVVLVGAGILGGYFFVNRGGDAPIVQNDSKESEPESNEIETELAITDFTVKGAEGDESFTVSVEHPSDWKVEEAEDRTWQYPNPIKLKGALTITASSGNSMVISDVSGGGFGGGCPEDVDMTLVKRIPTKIDGYVFEQLEDNKSSEYTRFLTLARSSVDSYSFSDDENLKLKAQEFADLEEGGVYTGECMIVFGYPHIFSPSKHSVISIVLNKNGDNNQGLTYDDIKDDPEFIKMLESLEVKE